jgi:CRP-like cAMP-binding protein
LSALRQVDFFSSLPMEALKVFAYLCARESYHAGEYLFHQNDVEGKAFCILDGELRLLLPAEGGEVQATLYKAGDFLGGLSLLGDVRRLFSLKAETDAVCLVLTREKFKKTLDQFPGVMPRLLEAVAERVLAWENQFIHDHADLCAHCHARLGASLV